MSNVIELSDKDLRKLRIKETEDLIFLDDLNEELLNPDEWDEPTNPEL